ncbi:hypothetical protein DSO57_1006800 [Entomophthora muscae]|uniref:Uncharacterized protein n=1 Tax=Entomophthora muscae TaxID=34485 RepID=A0ACC2S9N3_9FUNG|nr:hypothetical protein DSO57_1006800 [Entomophthora muscae]
MYTTGNTVLVATLLSAIGATYLPSGKYVKGISGYLSSGQSAMESSAEFNKFEVADANEVIVSSGRYKWGPQRANYNDDSEDEDSRSIQGSGCGSEDEDTEDMERDMSDGKASNNFNQYMQQVSYNSETSDKYHVKEWYSTGNGDSLSNNALSYEYTPESEEVFDDESPMPYQTNAPETGSYMSSNTENSTEDSMLARNDMSIQTNAPMKGSYMSSGNSMEDSMLARNDMTIQTDAPMKGSYMSSGNSMEDSMLARNDMTIQTDAPMKGSYMSSNTENSMQDSMLARNDMTIQTNLPMKGSYVSSNTENSMDDSMLARNVMPSENSIDESMLARNGMSSDNLMDESMLAGNVMTSDNEEAMDLSKNDSTLANNQLSYQSEAPMSESNVTFNQSEAPTTQVSSYQGESTMSSENSYYASSCSGPIAMERQAEQENFVDQVPAKRVYQSGSLSANMKYTAVNEVEY